MTATSERQIAIDELDHAIVNLSANINASTYQLLVLIREFDERAGWLKWGFDNCASWLHWRCDLSRGAAREKVRVAHALKALAGLSAAFEKGRLSYSKVRALARVATPVNESSLLDFALSHCASTVEERCQQIRNASPGAADTANRAHERRSVRVWRNHERATMTVTAELSIEMGELLCQALDKAVEAHPDPGPVFEEVSWTARQADALVAVARDYLSGGSSKSGVSTAESYRVVVHVDEAALRGEGGHSDLAVDTVKRLSCEGSVVQIVDDEHGEPLRVGRQQRTVPTALKRALWSRDRGCSFPGCRHTRFVDAHHVRHWANGGDTSLENTMLLCSSHHRLVHEGGYDICKDHLGRWYFRRLDGRAIPAHGYQPDDVIDDGIDDHRQLYVTDDSAESFQGSAVTAGVLSVQEPAFAQYAVN